MNLGHKVGRNTIKRILQEHGIDPAPERGRRMSWATFIVLSIESECLDRSVPLGERQLRSAVAEYMRHYHHERNPQGLGIVGNPQVAAGEGAVAGRERLGGLLSFYPPGRGVNGGDRVWHQPPMPSVWVTCRAVVAATTTLTVVVSPVRGRICAISATPSRSSVWPSASRRALLSWSCVIPR
jgi:hypothetical protein